MKTAYLKITLKIDDADRSAAAGVYAKYKKPFLDTVSGADPDVRIYEIFESE